MSQELTDDEIVPLLRRALNVERHERQVWVWLENGAVLEIGPSWRGVCRALFYDPDEANRLTL